MNARDDQTDPIEVLRRAKDSVPPAGTQERVLALLSANGFGATAGSDALGGSALGGAAAVAGRSLWQWAGHFAAWSLLPLAAGVVIGVKGPALIGSERRPAPMASAAPLASALPTAMVAPSSPALPPTSALERSVNDAAPGPSAKHDLPQKRLPSDALAQERAVLDRARQKLAVSEPEHALQFLEQHAHRYPNGTLTEEREAMRVIVLVSLGRTEEARARGATFSKRFPSSLMLSSVKAALAAAARE